MGITKKGNVNFKLAAIFGPVAMGELLGARISALMTGQTQLVLFAIIMLLASIFMLKGRKDYEAKDVELNYYLIILEGLIVGIVTGIVGVGGGFLIVPALVLLAGQSMKKAVGTSLLIISLKSFSGFVGYLGQVEIPWFFLLQFTMFSGLGILVGSALVQYVSQRVLKKVLRYFSSLWVCLSSIKIERLSQRRQVLFHRQGPFCIRLRYVKMEQWQMLN